jgi:dephospho-CoA kinase
VLEAAVLFEAGLHVICDETWFVDADEELRIARLAAARGWDRGRAELVIGAQGGMSAVRARCDRVIDGAAPEECLRAAVKEWTDPPGLAAGGA